MEGGTVRVKSWLEISGGRLAANCRALAATAGAGTTVLAVVKANAYGHGLSVCAPVLAGAGAAWLGVTDAAEGTTVRAALARAGIAPEQQAQVLVMCGLLQAEAAAIVAQRLTPVVWDVEQLAWLQAAVRAQAAQPLGVHVEVDTGMARQGAVPGAELDALLTALAASPELRLDGVMTHFASAEVVDSAQTLKQRRSFEQALDVVARAGLRPGWVHAGNSSSLDNRTALESGHADSKTWLEDMAEKLGARAMVRAGLGLYGYCLPLEFASGEAGIAMGEAQACMAQVQPRLEPVMTWKTRVTGVREVPAGATVGYNATFVAERPMRLALLPVGYADGLRRELSGGDGERGGWAMIDGQRARIVGRVSMNLTVVDVTEVPGVRVGDEVVVLGAGVTAEDHAGLAGTIAYEILCGVKGEPRLVDA
jgi:alanine racemase